MNLATNSFKHALAEGTPQAGIWNSLCSNIASDALALVRLRLGAARHGAFAE